jgi:hypothetical protein
MRREQWNKCTVCGAYGPYWYDGVYRLVRYSTRSYAHWACLVQRKGEAFAVAAVPAWKLPMIDRGAP